MKADCIIRAALQSDAVELKNLFQNTVLAINRRDYSQAEVEDWASCGDNLSNIEDMIKTHYFIVAVNQQSEIVGFHLSLPRVIYTLCLFTRIFKVKALLQCF